MSSLKTGQQIMEWLLRRDHKLVLAESCTAGLISASLGLVPGISRCLCGSSVVYREQTKVAWLGVPQSTLHAFSAESAEVTSEITCAVLKATVEADWSLGITGHLGPGCENEADGLVFISCWRRQDDDRREFAACQHQLTTKTRADRQSEAAAVALTFLLERLRQS